MTTNQPLFSLAIDHRNSLVTSFFGITGVPTDDQQAACCQAKKLVYDGLCQAMGIGLPVGTPAILVDEQYGSSVIDTARRDDVAVIVPFEVSGQRELAFSYGNDGTAAALQRLQPNFAKLLVRYHPDGDLQSNARQRARMRQFAQWCQDAGIPWMLELLVPPLDAHTPWNVAARCEATVRAINELNSDGIVPNLWKLEGMDTTEQFQLVAHACRASDGCLVLGRGADHAAVEQWLRLAAPVTGFTGFAVGRTIWWEPLRDFFRGAASERAATHRIAHTYLRLVALYRDALESARE